MIRQCRGALTIIALAILLPLSTLPAQIGPPTPTPPPVGGVALDADGMIHNRQAESQPNLALLRARVQAAEKAPQDKDLTYISLPRILQQIHELTAAKKPIPQELLCLGGLTQLRYIFLFPDQQDLVLAGTAEDIDSASPLEPVGKTSGRPVLQFEDLIVALRTIDAPKGNDFFGCSIDTNPDMLKKSEEVVAKYATAPQPELMKQIALAVGPQKVSVINTAADTRLAFIMVAADFKLKRYALGLEASSVVPIGHAVDDSRTAACRFWFTPSYEALLVSADADAYALRGPRLQLKSGAATLDDRGATPNAKAWAKKFTAQFPALTAVTPLFADLQNIADMALLAALIRQDKLDQKIGPDLAWAVDSYQLTKVLVPRTTETQVNVTTGSVASGGIALAMFPLVNPAARQKDTAGILAALRQRPTNGWLLKAANSKKQEPVA